MARVAELFPDATDYIDVYERAGGLGPRSLLAHAIHMSDREIERVAATGTALAHCPVSNMFLSSGVMPLARYREAGIRVGLGSDVAGAPELSILTQMREGFYQQSSRAATTPGYRSCPTRSTGSGWERSGGPRRSGSMA